MEGHFRLFSSFKKLYIYIYFSAKARLSSARDLDISNDPHGPQSSKLEGKDSSSKTKTEISSKDDLLTKDKSPTVGRGSISEETLVTNSTQSRLLRNSNFKNKKNEKCQKIVLSF